MKKIIRKTLWITVITLVVSLASSCSSDSDSDSKFVNLAGVWALDGNPVHIDENGNANFYTRLVDVQYKENYLRHDGCAKFEFIPSMHIMQVTNNDGVINYNVTKINRTEIDLEDPRTRETKTLLKCGHLISKAPKSVAGTFLWCAPWEVGLEFKSDGTVRQHFFPEDEIEELGSSYSYEIMGGRKGQITYKLKFKTMKGMTFNIDGLIIIEFLNEYKYNDGKIISYCGLIQGDVYKTVTYDRTGETYHYRLKPENSFVELDWSADI